MARRLVVLAAKAKAPAGKGFGAAPKGGNKGIALEAPCPCGSGAAYEACCSPYHRGDAPVPTPEALLRSRYSAYAAKDPQFIADTTHPDSPEYTGSRASYIGTVKQTMRRLDPLQLSILGSEPGQDANEAFISFRLKRRIKDPETPRNAPEVDEVVERSRFVRVSNKWYYLDSTFVDEQEQQQGGAAAAPAAQPQQQEPPKKKGLLPFF